MSDQFTFPLASFIPFRDEAECARVRAITRDQITEHPNPEFEIRIIDTKPHFYFHFALDFVSRIEQALEEGRDLVAILPVGPVPQFYYAAELINSRKLSCKHLTTFIMDEYADDEGNTAPLSWPGSFQRAMRDNFFDLLDPDLRPSDDKIHAPTSDIVADYRQMIADLGGADICYGGIGWGGHIAFWEPQLGDVYGDDLGAYRAARAQLVELHPMTIMQNALHSFGGDWSMVPPKATTIAPADILGAKHRSFWLDGYLGEGISWQRFIARLVAHGPVNTHVPGSILQETNTTYTLLGGVADDLEVAMA